MNYSFASAPNTPYIAQADGRNALSNGSGGTQIRLASNSLAPPAATAGGMVGGSRATDPLNDIGSPVSLQYLQFAMSSPFFISGGSNGGGPVAAGAGAGGKREAAPAVVVTGTLSPLLDDSLSGFIHPAEVFTTPEMRQMSDVTQKTPDLALFDDADAIMSALSPRTQTAQAGLSLLAASATYARSPGAGRGDEAAPVGSPFLNALGVDATLMSQPQNSLAHQL
ncbi:hypothetical protein EV174_003297, partial [Coemansia sp. RSA 2320]